MKNVVKLIWRATKVILGSVVCVALIGGGGYCICKGLNWLTGVVITLLTAAAKFVIGNWVALLIAIIALLLGAIAFEIIVDKLSEKRKAKAATKNNSN